MASFRTWAVLALLALLALTVSVRATETEASLEQQVEFELEAEAEADMQAMAEAEAEAAEDADALALLSVSEEQVSEALDELSQEEPEFNQAELLERFSLKKLARKAGRAVKNSVKRVAQKTGQKIARVAHKAKNWVKGKIKKVAKFLHRHHGHHHHHRQHPKLTRPLIDGVLSSPYKRQNLNLAADIIKSEPAIAKLDKPAEDEWNGEEDGEDRFALEKKLKEELRGLVTLVKQSKQIIKALPSKERRIEQIKNKIEALRNEYAKEDAILKYKQQKALMKQIAKQELALKERVHALKSTEGKLQSNIQKHRDTLRDVGVREQEMKILDM